jgi:pyruvate,water dikinase
MSEYVLWFEDADAITQDLVGGKGINLSKLAVAGFRVPPGFLLTTEAYTLFTAQNGLGDKISTILAGIDYSDAPQVERETASIRDLIDATPLPAVVHEQLLAAYAKLGTDPYVAVRSSGTAEDLPGASFAGLHDTFLDVNGVAALAAAVKGCWASLWTARATSYRQQNNFDHDAAALCAVVQMMISSEASGVMFTANPLTASTEEFTINSSWGLGEAVVQGIVTPDEFTVRHDPIVIRNKTLGEKGLRIDRNPDAASGTITTDVAEIDRGKFTLSDYQIVELTRLGLRVMECYGGIPQDIEWGLFEGQLYLLQSRPVTGVDFSWDECLDAAFAELEDSDDFVWTHAWADAVWTGAVTPLFYSHRANCNTRAYNFYAKLNGFDDGPAKMKVFKYHRGTAYFNSNYDVETVKAAALPIFRAGMLGYIPPAWHKDVMDAPLSIGGWLKLQARYYAMDPLRGGHYKFWKLLDDKYIFGDRWYPANLPELGTLSNAELKREIRKYCEEEAEYAADVGFGFVQHCRDAVALMNLMLNSWYDGENYTVLTDLMSGAMERTATVEESHRLYELSETIRNTPILLSTFRNTEGAGFFQACEDTEEGRAFLKEYQEFAEGSSWRGHAERDTYFARRGNDPGIDYRNFNAMLSTETPVHPEIREREINARRDAAYEDVIEHLKKKPLGFLRVEGFKILFSYVQRLVINRDQERWAIDRNTMCIKLLFEELGRRVHAKGLTNEFKDMYFLAQDELWDLYEGRGNQTLAQAKIAGRKKNWKRFGAGELDTPMYLQRRRSVHADNEIEDGSGVLRGNGTSAGTVTGVARCIRIVEDIGRLQPGEILVCVGTDPGWTPVFSIAKGIVHEGGGLLAHASCLAREYGLPAVQLPGAMKLIPDGAIITIRGDDGVVVLDESGADQPEMEDRRKIIMQINP